MRKIYFFAVVALALAACDNDDKYVDNEPVAAQITANIGNSISSRRNGVGYGRQNRYHHFPRKRAGSEREQVRQYGIHHRKR